MLVLRFSQFMSSDLKIYCVLSFLILTDLSFSFCLTQINCECVCILYFMANNNYNIGNNNDYKTHLLKIYKSLI